MIGRVIVSGAGIAGLALGHWLARLGMTPLLIERAPRLQPLGHYISLKGNGVEMVRRMGILAACEARAVPIEDVQLFTGAGRPLRRERTAALARTLGGYILFRRSDLQAALHDLVRDRVEIRFGGSITAVATTADVVEVTLDDGRVERGDLLVGADGIHSRVRALAFGGAGERPLGGHYLAISQTMRHGLPPVWYSYLGRGIMVNLLPVAPELVSAAIYVGAGRPPPPRAPLEMRDYLLAACAGFPEHVRRVLAGIGPDDFVFADVIAQVSLPRITGARCALAGDAAHCPTFLSGMGAGLALQDAHVLAGCLARAPDDLPGALARYQAVVTPIARRYAESAVRAHALLLGPSRLRATLRDLLLPLLPERLLERGMRRFIDAERPLPDVPRVS